MNGSSDVSGVPDSALEQWGWLNSPFAPAGVETAWVLDVDGARLELPHDRSELELAWQGIYCSAGFDAIETVYDAMVKANAVPREEREEAQLTQPSAGTLDQSLIERVGRAKTLRQRRAELISNSRAILDDLAGMEEAAQRWYEGKLLEVVAAELGLKQQQIAEIWKAYDIGPRGSTAALPIEQVTDPASLRIRSREGAVTAPGYGDRIIQGEGDKSRDVMVHPVLIAVHETGVAWYYYAQALKVRSDSRAIRKRQPVHRDDIPAYPLWKQFRDRMREHGPAHPIVYATYRDAVTTRTELVFRARRLERIVIGALLKAHSTLPELSQLIAREALFADAGPLARTGTGGLPVTAAAIGIRRRYGSAPAPLRAVAVAAVPSPKAQDVNYSPWLQQPFHKQLRTVNDVLSARRSRKAIAQILGAGAPAAGEPPSAEEAVAHLLGLFSDDADQRMLRWCFSLGSVALRARLEVTRRLQEHIASERELYDKVRNAVTAAGVALAPLTEGASLLFAGVVDAMLVGGATADRVAQFVAAEQFSAVVLDELTALYWREPVVADLVGTLLEAGFTIAQDLAQEGVLGRVLDTMAVIVAVSSVTGGPSGP